MGIHTRVATLAGAILLLATTGMAQERATATIKMADGGKLIGHATRYDGATQTLYFTTTDGKDLVLNIKDLDARSAYLVNRSNPAKDDAESQLQTANFARDAGLYAHASRHYKYARRADPTMAKEIDAQVEILRSKAAAYSMENLEKARAEGNRSQATKWAKILLDKLPGTPEAERARQMMDDLYAASHDSRDDELEASSADLLAGELKTGKKAYDSMLENNKKGLVAKNSSSARRAFGLAVKKGELALKEIDKVAKKNSDATSQATLAGYRKFVVDQLVETHLNVASSFMVQSDFKGAARETNKALALDPSSASAKSMRSRVENASSRGIGGWW